MSNIEWTGETWNPLIGCSKISAGCSKCYAIPQAFRNWKMAEALPEDKRGRLAYYEGLTKSMSEWSGEVAFVPEALKIPLKRKKPTTYFVNSMSDLFHDKVKDEWLDQIFAVMALTRQHTYQILTKRPQRMFDYFADIESRRIAIASTIITPGNLIYNLKRYGDTAKIRFSLPLPNVWLGVSVENQKAANERIPLLLETPAAIRFLSCEPLLEKVDLTKCGDDDYSINAFNGNESYGVSRRKGVVPGIDWVIVGGESGHNARPCSLEWIEEIVEQCLADDVAVFIKQLGSNPQGIDFKLSDKKGGDFNQFPASIQFRKMPFLA